MPSLNCAVLRLKGPMQSWGTSAQFSQRTTGAFPSKSAVAGLVCAALGLPRGSRAEREFLIEFRKLRMAAAAAVCGEKLKSSRLVDFHTVLGTTTADGKVKESHMTYRHYLTDAEFFVFLSGPQDLVAKIGAALEDPVWGVWLGRKSCIPSAKVFAGFCEDQEAGLREFFPYGGFLLAEDAEAFEDAQDYEPDVPVTFESAGRVFDMRRIKYRREAPAA